MQFWGVEVKAGEPHIVKPIPSRAIHLSQAALEPKKEKGNDSVLISVKVGDKKVVLGTLSLDKFPQLSFDLVFDSQFELSHNGKSGSVHFCGYEALVGGDGFSDSYSEDEDEDNDVPLRIAGNGKAEPSIENVKNVTNKSDPGKPAPSSKPKDRLAKPSKDDLPGDEPDEEDDSDEDESGEEDLGDEDDDSEEGMSADEDSDEEDDSESEDEETPKKIEGKKRPNDTVTKTPMSSKKAKPDTPQKTDSKKAGHVSTPHPAKNAGKTSANGKQTPKSAGQFSCKSCDRSFGSDAALKSHSQAKHGGK